MPLADIFDPLYLCHSKLCTNKYLHVGPLSCHIVHALHSQSSYLPCFYGVSMFRTLDEPFPSYEILSINSNKLQNLCEFGYGAGP